MKHQKRKQDGKIGNATKRKRISKHQENIFNSAINKMEEAFLRFPHLPEQIFGKLDNKSLTNARLVRASWCNFVDEREYSLTRIKDIIANFDNGDSAFENRRNGETIFHYVCKQGYAGIAEIIVKKDHN